MNESANLTRGCLAEWHRTATSAAPDVRRGRRGLVAREAHQAEVGLGLGRRQRDVLGALPLLLDRFADRGVGVPAPVEAPRRAEPQDAAVGAALVLPLLYRTVAGEAARTTATRHFADFPPV